MKKTIFLLLLCFFNIVATAQLFKEDRLGVSLKLKEGILLAHRPVMVHLLQGQIHCVEASVLWKANKRFGWKSDYKQPTYGFTANFSNLGNPQILGNYFSAFGFIELPILNNEKWSFDGRIALGTVYVTKVYDKEDNPKNNAIGTKLNGFVQLGFTLKRSFENSNIHAGVDFSHISSGAFKMPNLGLNLPYLGIGYTKFLRDEKFLEPENRIDILPRYPWSFSAIGIISAKEVDPIGGKRYPVYGLSLNAEKRFGAKNGINFALDGILNYATQTFAEEGVGSTKEVFQIGTYFGYVLHIGNLKGIVGMGYYLKDNFKAGDPVYHRLGLRYMCKNRLIFNFTIKSHWGKADYLEYGIGYRFK